MSFAAHVAVDGGVWTYSLRGHVDQLAVACVGRRRSIGRATEERKQECKSSQASTRERADWRGQLKQSGCEEKESGALGMREDGGRRRSVFMERWREMTMMCGLVWRVSTVLAGVC